jgi:shikimate kinase
MTSTNIALIGARGAGKSKISKKLSKLIKWQTFSTDDLISYEAGGLSIDHLVSKRGGWTGFRDREFFVLDRLVEMKGVIIDCGGGILVEAPQEKSLEETFSTRKANCLKRSCYTIYLQRNMDEACEKMNPDPNRPNLLGDYRKILQKRFPWYEKNNDLTIDLSTHPIKEATDLIYQQLKKLNIIK